METKNNRPILTHPLWRDIFQPVALIVLVISFGFLAYHTLAETTALAQKPESNSPTSSSAWEEETGLQVKMIAVTAKGGMVDFRFIVTDPVKAKNLLQNEKKLPILRAEGGTISLSPSADTLQNIDLQQGFVYYILYSNTGDSVKPGSLVSVTIGDLQLEPIKAK